MHNLMKKQLYDHKLQTVENNNTIIFIHYSIMVANKKEKKEQTKLHTLAQAQSQSDRQCCQCR